jgi:septal ring factor EnvC (AmiA/AmiB activator)
MKNLSLILRILAIVAAVVATTLFFISKGKLADKQTELEQTKQVLSSTETELSDARNVVQRTETQLKREQKNLAETKSELQETESSLYAAQQEATRAKNSLEAANAEIAALEKEADEIRANLVATEEELAGASREAEINQLNQRIAQLEEQNEELKTDLESKTAIADAVSAKKTTSGGQSKPAINTSLTSFSPGGEPIQRIRLETTVNSVSAADGLIVLDSKPELGLSAGQIITLVQDLKAVGKIQIEKIENNYAVANILPGSSGTKKLSSGSTVQLLL